MTDAEMEAELATHGRSCDCPHKLACENREEWLLAHLGRRSPAPPTCEGRSPNDGYNALRQFCLGNWWRDSAPPLHEFPSAAVAEERKREYAEAAVAAYLQDAADKMCFWCRKRVPLSVDTPGMHTKGNGCVLGPVRALPLTTAALDRMLAEAEKRGEQRGAAG